MQSLVQLLCDSWASIAHQCHQWGWIYEGLAHCASMWLVTQLFPCFWRNDCVELMVKEMTDIVMFYLICVRGFMDCTYQATTPLAGYEYTIFILSSWCVNNKMDIFCHLEIVTEIYKGYSWISAHVTTFSLIECIDVCGSKFWLLQTIKTKKASLRSCPNL